MITSFLGAAYANKNASLISLIDSAKDITIFAPNNAAMETVSEALTSMSEDELDRLLSYHLVIKSGTDGSAGGSNSSGEAGRGPYYSTQLTNATSLPTHNPLLSISISSLSNSLFANSARILTSDLLIAAGVVHVIDNVLNPESVNVAPEPSLATQSPVFETVDGDAEGGSPFTSYVPALEVLTAQPTGTAGVGTYGAGATGSRTSAASGRAATQTAVRGAAAAGVREQGWYLLLGLGTATAGLTGWLMINV